MSKTYIGDRTIDGIIVTVDGEPLRDYADVKQHSPDGFEWSYEGVAPRQLAFALLMDHLGNAEQAARYDEAFMRDVTANFENYWEITSEDIDRVLGRYGHSGAAMGEAAQ